MKLQISERPIPVRNKLSATHELYNRYAGMLLGYLIEIVKDQKLAENYLVDIFDELPMYIDDYLTSERSVWVQLQTLAKSKLSTFFDTKKDCKVLTDEIHKRQDSKLTHKLNNMTALQRTVFCGTYYHNKTVMVIAAELHESEDSIKRLLKEAFSIIRNVR